MCTLRGRQGHGIGNRAGGAGSAVQVLETLTTATLPEILQAQQNPHIELRYVCSPNDGSLCPECYQKNRSVNTIHTFDRGSFAPQMMDQHAHNVLNALNDQFPDGVQRGSVHTHAHTHTHIYAHIFLLAHAAYARRAQQAKAGTV